MGHFLTPRRCRSASGLTVVLMFAGALVSCGDESSGRSNRAGEEVASSASSPFSVGSMPVGYQPVRAGMGTAVQEWGSDSVGTQEPFTVLAPVGEVPDPANVMVVSVTGFDGYEGGLAQASASYVGDGEQQAIEVDGDRGYFTGPSNASSLRPKRDTSELLLAVGDDLAVRVTAPGGEWTSESMARIVRATTPDADHQRAPRVNPPDGWEAVGSVDASLHFSYNAWGTELGNDDVRGMPSAHSAVWKLGEDRVLVMAIPGNEIDLPALVGAPRLLGSMAHSSTEVKVGDRAAVAMEQRSFCGSEPCQADADAFGPNVVYSTTDWGDVVAVSSYGPSAPDHRELAKIAASVTRSDVATWGRFVVDAAGGPGLHPDADATELTRGEAAGVEWLLQAIPAQRSRMGGSGSMSGTIADSCLRLSNSKRVCASGMSGGESATVAYSQAEPGVPVGVLGLPGFVIITTESPTARSFAVTAGKERVVAGLFDIPGQSGRRAGVAFVERPGMPSCLDANDPAMFAAGSLDLMRVDLLDGSGSEIGCAGIG